MMLGKQLSFDVLEIVEKSIGDRMKKVLELERGGTPRIPELVSGSDL